MPGGPKRSSINRADALRLHSALGDAGVAGPARVLGFVWQPETEAPEDSGKRKVPATVSPPPPFQPPARRAMSPVPFWRARALIPRERTPTQAATVEMAAFEPLRPEDLRARGKVPPTPPIVSEARLRRRLDRALRSARPGRDIDVEALVARLARGHGLEVLPRRSGLRQALVVVLLDNAERLTVFHDDIAELALSLYRRLDAANVRFLPAPSRRHGTRALRRAVGAADVVLAVSDLGFYGAERDRARWAELGATLRKDGLELRALVPRPAWRWSKLLARLWHAIDWSRPEGPGRVRAPVPAAGVPAASPVEALLALAAPAVRMEPGLLRALRRVLGPAADLGTEADVWNHPEVDGSSTSTLELEPALSQALKAKGLGAGWDRDLVGRAARTIVRWHRPLADLVWATDVWHLCACGVEEGALGEEVVAAAEEVLARAAASADREGQAASEVKHGLLRFLSRAKDRAPGGGSDHQRFSGLLERVVEIVREHDPDAVLPSEPTPTMLDHDRHAPPPRRFAVRQQGARLLVAPGDLEAQGSMIATWMVGHRDVALGDGSSPAERVKLDDAAAVAIDCPAPEGRLVLVSDHETVEVEAWSPPSWATRTGRDGHGAWAELEVEGVAQRLRWISPGRFMMGSPESEDGRWDNEGPQHEVHITEGYWLAETPCTQALWEAVMGDNPSRFRSPNRPVETVSWDDCQRFLDRLNFRFRDLELELPTEAEWEYACRASTDTATWRGALAIRGANDAPGLNPIAWYGGNSGVAFDLAEGTDSSNWPDKQFPHDQAGARRVADKAPNPWGLYDMLGNVFEWCQDGWRDYELGLETNPVGPDEAGLNRIIRGGSWRELARYVRAACRFVRRPDLRGGDLGFRLSRGSRAGGAQGEVAGARDGAERRGTSRRARRRRSRAWVDRLDWAIDGGVDRFGRWAAIEVGGLRHGLRWIAPGRFAMGSPESEQGRYADEGPQHEVTLTEGFWLGETLVTQALWQAVMGQNPSRFVSPDRPVESVSHEDCEAFLERLNGLIPGLGGRMPTEAQWEYACRAGTTGATYRGDLLIRGERDAPALDAMAWYGGNSGVDFELDTGHDSRDWPEKQYPHVLAGSHPVGRKLPNAWGLYDMLGNVNEWCRDSWHPGAPYPKGPRVDPVGEGGSYRVIRGGSWSEHARFLRAAYRRGFPPGFRFVDVGFRLSRGPSPEPEAEGRGGAGTPSRGRQARDEPPARPEKRVERPDRDEP